MDNLELRAKLYGTCPICGRPKELNGYLSSGPSTQCPIWRIHERDASEARR